MASKLSPYRRIVVKIGSSLLVDRKDGLKGGWLDSLCDDIAELRAAGHEILVVSSGAIALGRTVLDLPARTLKLEENQAAAAVGQIALARVFSQSLARHGLTAGQILLTLGDTEQRRRYLNARATISTLLQLGSVPVINENDTVATSEIRYGDNDRLAARVATMMTADLLILLSDVDGLYSAPPKLNPDARFVDHVGEITADIEAMAGDVGTELSRGGMVTKIEAAKVASRGGTAMVIASGRAEHPLEALARGARATWFDPVGSSSSARKKWIAGQLPRERAVVIDEGAEQALRRGKSLLPAGVVDVRGTFTRGDTVAIVNAAGARLGQGLIAYDSADAQRIAGRRSSEIEQLLGFSGRAEMIHRDDLIVEAAAKAAVVRE